MGKNAWSNMWLKSTIPHEYGGYDWWVLESSYRKINSNQKEIIPPTIKNGKIVFIKTSLMDYNEKLLVKYTNKNKRGCDNSEFNKIMIGWKIWRKLLKT